MLLKRYSARILHLFINVVPVAFFVIAIYLFQNELAAISFAELKTELANWSIYRIEWSIVFVFLSFVALSGYDLFGLRKQNEMLPYPKVFKVSFMGFSLSNLVGHSLFSGTSLRLKLYGRENVPLLAITRLSIENTVAVWLGFILLGGIGFVAFPDDGLLVGFGVKFTQLLGYALLASIVVVLIGARFLRKEFSVGKFSLCYPTVQTVLVFLLIATVDLALCAATLYVLLPTAVGFSFFHFLCIFIIAQLIGMVSQVPGGFGVFDAIFLKLYAPHAENEIILTALIIFRIIYYALPFAITTLWIGFDYLRVRSARVVPALDVLRVIAGPLVAQSLAILTFASGALLLMSGNIPAIESRIDMLTDIVPLYVLEFSHIAGSIAGLLLLILSFELWAKSRKALHLSQIVLIVGIVASLLKGFDYEEALALSIILWCSWVFRGAFFRKQGSGFRNLSSIQVMAITLCLSASVWLGFFAYKAVPYTDELWFTFGATEDSARFIRSLLIVLVSFSLILARSYLRGHRQPKLPPLSPDDFLHIQEILNTTTDTEAQLVWLGDKQVLLSDDKRSFLMFGIQGSRWIVLGDVYGNKASAKLLLFQFIQLADRYDVTPAFYQLSENSLALTLEAGFQVFKLGEEAHIELPKFNLEGTARRSLRASMNRGEREGLVFRIMDQAEVLAKLPQLRSISESWLVEKHANEKGFSLGYFKDDYVARFECAVVEQNSAIIAFATMLDGAGRELSIDLMRHRVGAPKSTMDFLFLNILMWGKGRGFETFNFGMSPLSGLRSTPWGPLWYKLGALIFKHGEYFYNFQGLRDYKEKYDPVWRMRFIAAPGGFSFLKTISDVALLIGGGAAGILGFGQAKK